ncbi:MAG TPA: hypothetical protein VEG30_02240 [Terriglobales bacterium]|nr:hypothetical protein [Terriglobales bacterium]
MPYCKIRHCVPALALALLLLSSQLLPGEKDPNAPSELVVFHSRIPLGVESFRLVPSGERFHLMASVESPEFEGWRHVTQDGQSHLFAKSGQLIRYYPEYLQFRVTASAHDRIVDEHPTPASSNHSLNDFLLSVRFRVKIFRGLEAKIIQPSIVDEIGVPRDVPYDERIYRVGFRLGHVPIEDRLVMEVISPKGDRLCKFHVDLL